MQFWCQPWRKGVKLKYPKGLWNINFELRLNLFSASLRIILCGDRPDGANISWVSFCGGTGEIRPDAWQQ
jgi:hypothetical protein